MTFNFKTESDVITEMENLAKAVSEGRIDHIVARDISELSKVALLAIQQQKYPFGGFNLLGGGIAKP